MEKPMARSQSAAADTDPPTPKADGDTAIAPAPTTSPLPPRFTAPDHVSAIILSTGREIGVENGVLTAPTDLSDDEQRQIARAGCSPI
jgi:hypothetical protein